MTFKRIMLWFLLVLPFTLKGQNSFSIQKDYADNLFKSQLYFDAVTEYKRLIFFDSVTVSRYEIYTRIGECYKGGAKFEEAIKCFSRALRIAADDDEIFRAKIGIIRANILRKTTLRALQLCDELSNDPRFKSKADEISYWRGWADMFADEWKNASIAFASINPKHELRKLAEDTDKSKLSVTFATVISYILPGAGSIYTGNILSGFMSLGWNVLAGFWTIGAFADSRALDGIAIGELVWLRFYRGSIENAGQFAIEKNIEIANKSLRFLQNEYKGIKP